MYRVKIIATSETLAEKDRSRLRSSLVYLATMRCLLILAFAALALAQTPSRPKIPDTFEAIVSNSGFLIGYKKNTLYSRCRVAAAAYYYYMYCKRNVPTPLQCLSHYFHHCPLHTAFNENLGLKESCAVEGRVQRAMVKIHVL